MIRNRTWRAWAVGAVVGADAVVLLVTGANVPTFLPFVLGALALGTLWALRRPGGWGAFTLLVLQVLGITLPTAQPRSALAWALTVASACAVIVTHVSLALLASWPRRADLPRETVRRWVLQTAALVWVAVLAAMAGLVASSTSQALIPWLGALALALVAGLAWQLRAATRRG